MAVPPDSSRVRDNVRGQTLMIFSAVLSLFVPVTFVHTAQKPPRNITFQRRSKEQKNVLGIFLRTFAAECPWDVLSDKVVRGFYVTVVTVPVKTVPVETVKIKIVKIFVICLRRRSVCVSAFYKKGPAAREAQRAASKKEMGFSVSINPRWTTEIYLNRISMVDINGISIAGRADVRGANIIEVARAGVFGLPRAIGECADPRAADGAP
ncbi:hypothetical protein G5I_13409 [Acromyrmex echinatior]|uniref:Uncharacterized protein n=1 Tax=Acromyrmex echinatior TaxID=103372 RepID=F4X4Y6_ACREC|nr:hypothetical protein G5I_13409 [Acromyrmex echinatior]